MDYNEDMNYCAKFDLENRKLMPARFLRGIEPIMEKELRLPLISEDISNKPRHVTTPENNVERIFFMTKRIQPTDLKKN